MQRGRVTGARSDGESLDSLGLEPGSLGAETPVFLSHGDGLCRTTGFLGS